MEIKTTMYVPEYLKRQKIWVLWRMEADESGEPKKVPYRVGSIKRASSTNPNTWASYDDTVQAYQHKQKSSFRYNGLGCVMHEDLGIVFIDIDHCIDVTSGELDDRSIDILSLFTDTYVEISQSGTGIHILARGTIPRGFNNRKDGVEMYSSGRFCAMTFRAFQPMEPSECQSEIDYVFEKYKTQKKETRPHSVSAFASVITDQELIDKASRFGNFASLYKGLWKEGKYESQSEADLALCVHLAYWSNRNPDVIDRIFRTSGLVRSKWDERRGEMTYGERTIQTACDMVDESVSERKGRRLNELNKSVMSRW